MIYLSGSDAGSWVLGALAKILSRQEGECRSAAARQSVLTASTAFGIIICVHQSSRALRVDQFPHDGEHVAE